jgi:site-specific DNA-methyltransferase (adenine-specific)
VKNSPFKKHENVVVFGVAGKKVNYNPQMEKGKPYVGPHRTSGEFVGNIKSKPTINKGERYPSSITKKYKRDLPSLHPTQKPVDLLEYLVKTYSNEGDTVLDFTMGSGSTGVACLRTNRKFIGIELDETYYNIAKERLENGNT